MQQGIARHGGLAKDGPTNLIRRDEPASGSVPSNAILRFEKSSNAHHASQTKNIPYALSGSFIHVFSGSSGVVFPDRPGQGGGFAFQTACELLASIGPGVGQTLSSLDILEFRLGLLNNEGTGYFDQIFSRAFSLLGRDYGRVVAP